MKKFLYILPVLAFMFMANNVFAAPYTANDFVITVKTNNPGSSSDVQFTIPTYPGLVYSYDVDCDYDGSNVGWDTFGEMGDYTCDYSGMGMGIYTIVIRGTFPRIYFNDSGDKEKLFTIEQWGTGAWTSMENAFYGCSNLTATYTDIPNLTNVTNMSRMFDSATNFNGSTTGWDTSNVTNMRFVFRDNSAFNDSGITNWNMSNVTDIYGMFWGASSFNQDIGNWNTSKIFDMGAVFWNATNFNQDISGWDTSQVTSMAFMFDNATNFNQDISGWNTSNLTTIRYIFYGTGSFNQDISSWDVSNVVNMDSAFRYAISFDQNLGSWNVGSVSSAVHMFGGSGLSVGNYDNILIGWNSLSPLQNGVTLGADGIHYCNSGTQRQNIIDTYGWTINDAGKNCPPVIAEVTPISTPTNDNTPTYVFRAVNLDGGLGTADWSGSCDGYFSENSNGVGAGNNSTTATTSMPDGTYSDCTLVVTDSADSSNVLSVSPFTIDTTAPTLAEVNPVSTPTSDTTPEYTFSSTEAGTITYGGSCSSTITNAVLGDNVITFNELPAGTYDDCTIIVTDVAGNVSTTLDVSEFMITESLYRFWSKKNKSHFYTANEKEKNYIIAHYDDYVWKYEGVANDVFTTQVPNSTPVYRFWSKKNKGHFYTASEEEKNYVINHYDDYIWKYEGIAYYAYPTQQPNTKPVYRFWSKKNKHHFYTASEEEKNLVISKYDDYVWKYEGEAWYVPSN